MRPRLSIARSIHARIVRCRRRCCRLALMRNPYQGPSSSCKVLPKKASITADDEDEDDEEEDKPQTKTVKETVWDWDLLNDNKALWLRSPSDVSEEEYVNFYMALAKVSFAQLSAHNLPVYEQFSAGEYVLQDNFCCAEDSRFIVAVHSGCPVRWCPSNSLLQPSKSCTDKFLSAVYVHAE